MGLEGKRCSRQGVGRRRDFCARWAVGRRGLGRNARSESRVDGLSGRFELHTRLPPVGSAYAGRGARRPIRVGHERSIQVDQSESTDPSQPIRVCQSESTTSRSESPPCSRFGAAAGRRPGYAPEPGSRARSGAARQRLLPAHGPWPGQDRAGLTAKKTRFRVAAARPAARPSRAGAGSASAGTGKPPCTAWAQTV